MSGQWLQHQLLHECQEPSSHGLLESAFIFACFTKVCKPALLNQFVPDYERKNGESSKDSPTATRSSEESRITDGDDWSLASSEIATLTATFVWRIP